MDQNKSNFKKWFRFFHGGIGTDPLKHHPRPFRDWHRLITIWLILLIMASVLQFWLFRNLQKSINQGIEQNASSTLPKLDPVKLHEVADYWQTRHATSTR